jgi:hypothetical protein
MAIYWQHVTPGGRIQASVLNQMLLEKERRDRIFDTPRTRLEFMNQIRTYVDIEALAMKANGDRESGAMRGADMANRVENMLDQIMDEVKFEI